MPQMIGEDHRSKSFSRRKVSQDQKTTGFGPEKPRTLGTLRHRTFCSTGFWETVVFFYTVSDSPVDELHLVGGFEMDDPVVRIGFQDAPDDVGDVHVVTIGFE